jgi:hypothetical protein
MVFLTVASVITSCSAVKSKTENQIESQAIIEALSQPVIFEVQNIEDREFVFACDLVNGLYICDRLNEIESIDM